MANNEQRGNKMTKKPKKDSAPIKAAGGSDRPVAPMTAVLPKGKEAKLKSK